MGPGGTTDDTRIWAAPDPATVRPGLPPMPPSRVVVPTITWDQPSRRRWRPRRGNGFTTALIAKLLPAVILFAILAFNVSRKPDSPYPDQWDSRIETLVAFVEHQRELTFDHPVEVEFLPTAEFDAGLTGFDPVYDTDVYAGSMYEGLGLADDYDADAASDTGASLVLGYFDGVGVKVRGDQLTAPVRTVLVHELTHAVQAQHFDSSSFTGPNSLAMIEGDAMRIENRYVETLSTDEQAQVNDELYLGDDAEATAALPWTIGELQAEPYVVGPSFLAVLEDEGGTAAVDAAIRNPPDDERLFDPWQYLDDEPISFLDQLEAEPPPHTEVVVPSRPFGLFEAIVVFDTWLPWAEVRDTLDAWRDGALVVVHQGIHTCVKVDMRVESTDDATRLTAMVDDWSAAAGTQVTVGDRLADGKPVVTFTSCGRVGPPVPDAPVMTPSWSISFENQFVGDLAESNPELSHGVTRCAARRLVDEQALLDYLADTDDSDAVWNGFVDMRDRVLAECEADPSLQPG
ncbi:MAG: hypothetical protein U0Q03_12600 [Acidimicrobiales bacterium]